jgi:hypothetical protein
MTPTSPVATPQSPEIVSVHVSILIKIAQNVRSSSGGLIALGVVSGIVHRKGREVVYVPLICPIEETAIRTLKDKEAIISTTGVIRLIYVPIIGIVVIGSLHYPGTPMGVAGTVQPT